MWLLYYIILFVIGPPMGHVVACMRIVNFTVKSTYDHMV